MVSQTKQAYPSHLAPDPLRQLDRGNSRKMVVGFEIGQHFEDRICDRRDGARRHDRLGGRDLDAPLQKLLLE